MIVGIAGLMGVGKSTVGDILAARHGFQIVSMADALRRECRNLIRNQSYPLDCPDDIKQILSQASIGDIDAKPTSPAVRRLLQWYGSEYRRQQNPNYWVQQVEPVLNHGLDIAIPDIRFRNEMEMVHWHGGQVWLIQRDPGTQDRHVRHHSEEFAVSNAPWDQILENNGDLQELEKAVGELVASWYSGETNDPISSLL